MKKRGALLLALASCAAPAKQPAPSPKPVIDGDTYVLVEAGAGKVGTYVSESWTFSTSTHWIEGPEGVVLFDVQFLPEPALEAVDWAERLTGKKVVAAFVLHANPDKFNGTAALQARGIKVYTSDQIIALIPSVHEKRVKAFYERYKPDYPLELPKPESFGSESQTMRVAGLDLELKVLGPACSEAHVAVFWEGHLFAGDLFANDAHSWLEIGKTDEWLKRIEELRALEPKRIYPGRGPAGGPNLLDQQTNYLNRVIELVAAENPTVPDDKEGIARAKEKIIAAFPGYRFAVFLNLGAKAEWNRQAKLKAAQSSANVDAE